MVLEQSEFCVAYDYSLSKYRGNFHQIVITTETIYITRHFSGIMFVLVSIMPTYH